MFIVSSYVVAVIFCIITMICWGSWANTQKMASKTWSFQLFYWDYTIGIIIISFLFAITLGSFGASGQSFFANLHQAAWVFLWSAFLGGIIFNLANILLVSAIDIAGMAVAFPVGIGIALVLGVIINYIKAPIGNMYLLFIGVGIITIGIILAAVAYNQLKKMDKTSDNSGVKKGLIISIIAGILMGFFYRFVAASMSINFHHIAVGKLTPYTAVFIFSLGIFVSNFLFNTLVMKMPFKGRKVKYSEYFKGSSKLHFVGILGGIVWGIGMTLNIIASGKAGYAISYGLGQGATLVAILWGVYVWKEFKSAKPKTHKLVKLMILLFLIGLIIVILARVY